MRATLLVAVLLCAAIAAATYDFCSSLRSCNRCLAHSSCGWCSTPVVFEDGHKGRNCVDFSNPRNPFICTGVFSTETCPAVPEAKLAVKSDHCNAYPTCALCVAEAFCGWCSTPVVYQNGDKGYQCAGFNPETPDPFVCHGIYSTKTCQSGYECDTQNYTCVLSPPGSGFPLDQCQANCSTVGKTFNCNNATHTCDPALPGQGTSFQQCQAACGTPSPPPTHSSSASPSPVTPTNHPPSPSPTAAPTYTCNGETLRCEKAQPGKGASLQVCMRECKKGNHTPTSLVGLWRTFPIGGVTPVDEYDLNFPANTNTVQIGERTFTSTCSVQSIGTREVWFVGCTAPEPSTLKCLWETTGTMPETYEAMMACNYAGGPDPKDFVSVMSAPGVTVVFMSRCVPDGYCKFNFGPGNGGSRHRALGSLFHRVGDQKNVGAQMSAVQEDPCRNYGSNCTFCLSHEYCGWCSTNVVYVDGTPGDQCAGFNPNPNIPNPFTCSGTYSTEMCVPGWTCNAENQTCVPAPPGSGIPNKGDCDTSCKAKPGPPSVLLGHWRGLLIENGYPFGVTKVTITQGGIDVSFMGQHVFSGTMKHVGGTIFITFTDGIHKGTTAGGMYSLQQNELVTYMDVALGGDNAPVPVNYKVAMLPPGTELVLAKCANAACTW